MTKKIYLPIHRKVRQPAVCMVPDDQGESNLAGRGHLFDRATLAARLMWAHWVRQAKRDEGLRAGSMSAEQERIRCLSVRPELARSDEICARSDAKISGPGGA